MSRIHQSNSENMRPAATLPSASPTGSAFELQGVAPRGIGVCVPSGWVSGQIGLQVSLDNASWLTVRDEYASAVSVSGLSNVAEDCIAPFPPAAWVAGVYNYARFVSYSAGVPGGLSAQPDVRNLSALLLS
jgi:hypothetical protein